MKFTKYRLDFLSRLHNYLQWRKRTLCAVIFAALSPVFAHANPDGAQIISGQVSIDQSVAGITTVTNSPNAIINWQNFNIAQNEITRFVQQNGQSAVLNRIIGGNPSEILGSLFSNGKVFLINPNGIVFGAGSQIDTQGLLASTLNLSDENFKRGNFHFVAGSKSGDITNEGIIHAGKDGNVVLIAPNIQNNGIIKSEGGKIVLAAGQELVLTSLDDPEIRFQVQSPKNRVLNIGQLLTEGGAINVFAGTLKHSGDISADSVEVDKQGNIRLVVKDDITLEKDSKTSANNEKGEAGKIEITGENVAVLDNSKIEAVGKTGGGEVLIGGDYQGKNPAVQNAQTTTIAEKVEIKADAKESGNGGKVIVWSDNETHVAATFSAKGGKKSGDGGLVETSGKQLKIADTTKVSTKAPKGKTGEWLLDPYNITISSTGSAESTNFTASETSDILASSISSALNLNNITISTGTVAGGDAGDIIVNAPISWASDTTLKLFAYRNIDINASITNTSTGTTNTKLALEYGQGAVALNNAATYNVRAPVNLPAGNNFSTKLGSDGTALLYTVINNLTVLQGLKDISGGGNYALGANINASETFSWNSGAGFEPIQTSTTRKFDGLGHTIDGLTIYRPGTYGVALFGGQVGYDIGEVRNLGLTNVNITGGTRTGAVVADLARGLIDNVYTTGTVTATDNGSAGGLVGLNSGIINNSYSSANVSASQAAGGLVAENHDGTINNPRYATILNSYSTGIITGTGSTNNFNTGGLVGKNNKGKIINSYSTSNVTGDLFVGGLVGANYSDGIIENSYSNTSTVTGNSNVGGLVGLNSGVVINSFWNKVTSNQLTSSGSPTAAGLTTAQLNDFINATTVTSSVSYFPQKVWDSLTKNAVSGTVNSSIFNREFEYAVDGISRGKFRTNGEGAFSFNYPIGNMQNVLIWLSGDGTNKAATLTNGSYLTDLKLELNTIYGHIDLDTAALNTAKGSISDNDIPFVFDGLTLTPATGTTTLALKANNDVIVNNAIATNGAAVSIKAGKSVYLNENKTINTNGTGISGNIEIVANADPTIDNVNNTHRGSEQAFIEMQTGSNLDAGLGVGGVAILMRRQDETAGDIILEPITVTTGTGDIKINTSKPIVLAGATLETNGGNIIIGSKINASNIVDDNTTTAGSYPDHAGDVSILIAADGNDVPIGFSSLNAVTGNINIKGKAIDPESSSTGVAVMAAEMQAANISLDGNVVGEFTDDNTNGIALVGRFDADENLVTTKLTATNSIQLNGTTNDYSKNNVGVYIDATELNTTTGAITISGAVNEDAINGGDASSNTGVDVWDSSIVSGNSMTITGSAQGDNVSYGNRGVAFGTDIELQTNITSHGAMTITGAANGTDSFNYGIEADSTEFFSDNNLMTFNGTGTYSGIDLDDDVLVGGAYFPTPSESWEFQAQTGNIDLIANKLTFANTGTSIAGTGSLNVNVTGSTATLPPITGASSVTAFSTGLLTANTISTTGSVLLKSNADIILPANKTITTQGGTVVLNADFDANQSGTITVNSGASLNANGGDITLISHGLSLTGTAQSSGVLTVKPSVDNTTIGIAGGAGTLQLPATYFSTNFVDGFSNINIGGATTGAITLGAALTVPTSANLTLQNAGNMALNGALTLASGKTLTLNSTGNVTQTAPITATNLLLLGAGNYALTNINNVISNLAANGVGNLSFVNSNAFAIDSVAGTNGISATGIVDISTYNGNLTVNQPVRTSNTTADALKLNAGSIETTTTTANILVGASGNDVFSVGTGGIAKFFTGSISGSTGLATLIGSGSGRFRYNSDESIPHYTTPLLPYDVNNATTTGLYAIYREQPFISLTVPTTYSSTYNAQPVSLPITLNNAQFPNGDGTLITTAIAQTTGAMPSLGLNVNGVPAGFPINAGTYSVTVTPISVGDFFGGLGYSITPTDLNSSVTISPAALSITANALSKTYGAVDPTLTYAESGLISGDTLTGSLSRNTGEEVGIYPINQGTLSAGTNYTINYTPANLTINSPTSGGGEVVIPNDPQPTPEEIAAQLEAERLAAEAAAKLEAERLAAEAAAKAEADRLAAEAAAKAEAERLAAVKAEAERLAAEAAARIEAERLAAEAAAKLEAERLAAEAAAKLEAERLAAEAAAKLEAERLAAEAAAKLEAERLAAEVAAKAEAERLAAEAAAKAEAERLAAEAAAKLEAERLAAEVAAKLEAERLAAEAAAKVESERLAAEAAAKLEAERLAAEAAAKAEAERLAAEAAAKAEAERLAAEAAAKAEAERLAAEAAAKAEAERLAAEAAAKAEAERLAAEAAAKAEAERLAAEAAAKAEAERLAAEAAAKAEAERLAAEAARIEVERLAAEAAAKAEAERLAAEAAAKLEAERLAAEAAAKLEAERLATEILNKPSTTGSTGINTETLVKNLGEALKDTPPEQVKEVVQKVEENVGNQTTTVLTMSAQQIAEPTSGSAPTASSAEKTSATDSTTSAKGEKQDKDDKKEDKKDKKADVVIAASGADSKAAKPLQQCK